MQPHQQRVVTEKQELDEKIAKLKAFIDASEIFKALPLMDRLLLDDQYALMILYTRVLGRRIERFDPRDSGA